MLLVSVARPKMARITIRSRFAVLKITSVLPDPYDAHPYTEHAYAETHPSRIAAVARLSGWHAPSPVDAKIVELGCGRGANLLPMAAGLSRATLVGVDQSARQIDDARRIATEAGTENVTFVHAAFDHMDAATGTFDYVICHGVLSWIPAPARAVLLDRVARLLSPSGVAHVSFNVLPGWYGRLAARDWLRFAESKLGVAAYGAADSVAWLRARVSPEQADYRRQLDAVAQRLGETDAAYARHEYLAEEHHPMLVGDFLDEASRAGLAYLGDALPEGTAFELLADEARSRAESLGAVDAQQFVDFVRCTAFRRSLLVRADEAHARGWNAPRALDREAVRSLWAASHLRPREEQAPVTAIETFEDGKQMVQVSDPTVRAALRELARVAPAALPFDEIVRRSTDDGARDASSGLAGELVDLWLATGSVDLLAAPPAIASVPDERPVACPVARWRAARGGTITNRLHQEVLVPDAIVRWVLARLDGTRTREDLARQARSLEGARGATEDELDRVVAASIERLFACALIVGC